MHGIILRKTKNDTSKMIYSATLTIKNGGRCTCNSIGLKQHAMQNTTNSSYINDYKLHLISSIL